MGKQAIWTGILSLAILAAFSSKAEACRYYWSHYCGYYPSAIGYCPAPTACYGCGACGPCVYKCRHHVCFPIIKHLCAKHAAHKAWRYGCGYGCLAPSCADSGNDCGGCGAYASCGGSAAPTGVPTEAQIISDRVLGEEGQPEAIDEGQSADANQASFRLAGYRKAGNAAFQNGLDSFRKGSMNEALGAFETAAQADPQNALYHYHRALALYDVSGPDAAADALRQAVQAEQREPVKDWGKRMERVQGRSRVWIEKARREAGLVR